MRQQRTLGLIPAGALGLVLAVLTHYGAVGAREALWIFGSVLCAQAPGLWLAPAPTWRRRLAEWSLVPLALAVVLVGHEDMRRLLTPPFLVLVVWCGYWAAADRVSARQRWVLMAASGVALRCAVGLGGASHSWWASVLALVSSALLPFAAARRGGRFMGAHALLVAVLPLEGQPVAGVAAVAVASLLLYLGPPERPPSRIWRRSFPLSGALTLALSCLAPWGGIPLAQIVSGLLGWWLLGGLVLCVALARWAPSPVVGLLFFSLVTLAIPVLDPPPDKGGSVLGPSYSRKALSPGLEGRPYLLDLALTSSAGLPDGTRVGTLHESGREIPLLAGVHAVEWAACRPFATPAMSHDLPARSIFRPATESGRRFWGVAGRNVFEVAPDVAPILERSPDLPPEVQLVIPTFGPSRVTAPRRISCAGLLWRVALVCALVQLLSRGLRAPWGGAPWVVLGAGALLLRLPVEPLRLALERYGVDLCLAALLLSWWPAFGRLWRGGRRVVAVAALFVPLALAAPLLSPPLYGDEPFHLAVLESLAHDGDLDLANNVDLGANPYHELFQAHGELFHSPVLALLLLPGYAVAGRSGALLILALAAAWVLRLLGQEVLVRGLGERRALTLVAATALSYPLAVFAMQIWPEMVGILAVVGVLAAVRGRSRWAATGGAVLAVAVKTRLALLTVPMTGLLWWRSRRRRTGILLLGPGAALALGVGWLFMGHPFGMYRRLGDLVPRDPKQALVVLGGLSFDAAGGLVFTVPVVLLALWGCRRLWQSGKVEAALLAGAAGTVIALLNSIEWYGGGAPPARYLVPAMPAAFLALVYVLRTPRVWRRLAEALCGAGILSWWVLVSRPHLSINPGDGGYWLADALARRFRLETRVFFPSFLTPSTATFLLPAVVIGLVCALWFLSRYRPALFRHVARSGVALWLLAAACLLAAMHHRTDRVVEMEAPQVHHRAGRPVPPPGTFSRYTHDNGWLLQSGGQLVIPLHLAANSAVFLEGRLQGSAAEMAAFELQWDDGEVERLRLRGAARRDGRLRLPDPPGPGRHQLRLTLRCPWAGSAVLDRIVVEEPRSIKGDSNTQ